MFFLLPTWFLVILGFLIVLCLPFWIIGGIITSVRRRKQAAISARDRQAKLAREVSRMELLEEHRALLKDVSKRSAALDPSLTEYFSDKTDSEFEADVLALIGQLNSEWILELLKEGLSEVEIVLSIKSRPAMYSLAIDQTIALKTAGVSEKVLAAMVAASALVETDPFMLRAYLRPLRAEGNQQVSQRLLMLGLATHSSSLFF